MVQAGVPAAMNVFLLVLSFKIEVAGLPRRQLRPQLQSRDGSRQYLKFVGQNTRQKLCLLQAAAEGEGMCFTLLLKPLQIRHHLHTRCQRH